MNLKNLKPKLKSPIRIADHNELTIIEELNSLLAEELQAWYQYFIIAPFLVGDERTSIQEFFKKAADDELNDHAKALLDRLNELQVYTSLLSPDTWASNAQSKFIVPVTNIAQALQQNIQAEQEAIQHYQKVIILAEQLGDFTTSELLKHNLADEESHLAELMDFVKDNI